MTRVVFSPLSLLALCCPLMLSTSAQAQVEYRLAQQAPQVKREYRVVQRVEQPKRVRVVQQVQPGRRELRYVIDAASATPVDLGKYWIGLSCTVASPAMRAQLAIDEGQGLVVESVHDDSPAAKAGVQQYDILLAAGDSRLGSVKGLIDAVQKAETNELTLSIIRKGEKSDIKVTAAERPESQRQIHVQTERVLKEGAAHRLYDWIARPNVDRQLHMMFVEPGVVVDGALRPALPGGVSISITRTGKEPAKLHIKRGDEEWKITEKELDKLPKDLRPHVQRMLGGGPMHLRHLQLPRNVPQFRAPQHHIQQGQPRSIIVRPQARSGEAAQDAALRQLRDELRKLSEKVKALEDEKKQD